MTMSVPRRLRRPFPVLAVAAQWRALRPSAARSYAHRRRKPGSEEEHRTGAEEEKKGERFRLHKSRGQHLLTNTRVLDAIVRNAGVLPGDDVLEIGPGTGNLTLRLLRAARRVVAVEVDPRMVDALHNRASDQGLADRLQVISGDALRMEFPQFDLCVANIPYGISSPLVEKILFDGGAPRRGYRCATLLLQKEFARRLAAVPGDSEFNRLAVNVGLVATVELLMDVSKRDFVPAPRVDSSLVRIQPKTELPAVDLEEWWAFTRLCFGQKNKTLGAVFRQKKKVEELFRRAKGGGRTRSSVGHEEEVALEDAADEHIGDHGDVGEGQRAEDVVLFKEKMIGILQRGEFLDKRPTKLSNGDMLHLLSLFNLEGVHFH